MFAGCGSNTSSGTDGGQAGGQGLVIGWTTVTNTLDPLHAEATQTNSPDALMYDRLVTYDKSGKVTAGLASEFALAADAKSLTLTLRSGVKFHDGTPLTANDVKFTLDRLHSLGQGIAGLVQNYQSTTVTDNQHLTITLKEPDTLFLGALSKVWILNSSLVTKNAGADQGQAWLATHEAGSGPYTLDSGSTPQLLQMTLFKDHWAGDTAARPATVQFKQVESPPTLLSLMKSKSVDMAMNLAPQDVQGVTEGGDVTVAKVPGLITMMIYFNTSTGPTSNPAVRKAIQLAYNYAEGRETIEGGYGVAVPGILPSGFACQPTFPERTQNLDEAKKLLADAGLSNLKLDLTYQPNKSDQKQQAALLQSDLAKIGVTLNLVPTTFPQYLASLKSFSSVPQMMLLTDAAAYPDPGAVLVPTYLSNRIGTNKAAFSDPAVDDLLNRAIRSSNEDDRCSLYKQAQQAIYDKAAALYMFATVSPVLYNAAKVDAASITPSATVPVIDLSEVRLK